MMFSQQLLSAVLRAIGMATLLVGLSSTAGAAVIDFESDTTGTKVNGFQSIDSALVRFSDSVGADLMISDFGVQSDGKSLAVYADDASELVMEFLTPVDSLSFFFGNDDPSWSSPGDLAVLKVFDGLTLVGQSTVEMNRDDRMNQSIGFSGAIFNRATFLFDVRPTNGGSGLIEIVDNVMFTPVADPAPEPGTLAILGLGITPLARALRRRTRRGG